ncbi:double-strand break repair protein AddB [Salipiger sp. P9]|uniref:double-strand break repair protein AddB n=1 Tax=Salipiger pentaromativorans TaxID=2943193 RepID=UPI002157123A|nr:double-strand break repair protein AddB [Salipiger pentaromativorans]MCR8549592.1 double-strand break repair protein AddB [Salipiger pentaromativorans]
MFDPGTTPRVFALASGVDFPAALVAGLRRRMAGQPPEAMARVELIVNTTRMARRIRQIFDSGPACLLPRIRLLGGVADPVALARLPAPVSPLRRRLELTGLVSKLLDAQPDLAPRTALFDLADSLATLMDEMQDEGVSPEIIAGLDVSDESGHWQRALSFLSIVQRYFDTGEDAPDTSAFRRLALEQRLKDWETRPPAHPVILAGSTGSRGMTNRLMRAVAGLPQGALVLPGFDFDTPERVWDGLSDALSGEDHPQFRFARLMADLGIRATEVMRWTDDPAPQPERNRLISLALRPAPVTDQWRDEGPALPDLAAATAELTLVEAPSQRDEATAIALRLRQAAEEGVTAALITPDRMLTRQVTAALDRWNILPDDSAGTPLQLTPPGRFLRHVAGLFQQELTAEALLTLLKHPLTHSTRARGEHLRATHELELHIRAKSWPYPQPEKLHAWGVAAKQESWAAWVVACFCQPPVRGTRSLSDWIATHLERAEKIAAGPEAEDSELWKEAAGRKTRSVVAALKAEAAHGTDLDPRDYADLFGAILAREELRDRDAPHPRILIWGTLEARVMGADLLILGGLNEGSWPELPGADPWLNRRMRHKAGLLVPERRIGLAAHDFQQAVAAPQVWLTRALKSDDAETVPSRWLNRLTNLMNGLPQRSGPEALKDMRRRGAHWLALARALEEPLPSAPAPRPSPAPPVAARPRRLSVTEIKHLIRDPFHIYAKRVLRLAPLNPLQRAPDALLRGTLIHRVLEEFIKESVSDPAQLRADVLLHKAAQIVGDPEIVPYPTTRHLWLARIARIADWFTETELARRTLAHPTHFEIMGQALIPALGFTLRGKADRIDIDARGNAHLYDYKTGTAPSPKEQRYFDKQLLLEAAMIERGAFKDLHPRHTERAVFVSVAATPKEVPAPLDEAPAAQVWDEFERLMTRWFERERGYTARAALLKEKDLSEYDHLSRFGEWDLIDTPKPEVLE